MKLEIWLSLLKVNDQILLWFELVLHFLVNVAFIVGLVREKSMCCDIFEFNFRVQMV